MTAQKTSPGDIVAIRESASGWTIRRDRGLSATESIEFELWLAADPRHAAAMRTIGSAWALLDRPPESLAQRELAAAVRRRSRRRHLLVFGAFAAAAAIVIAAIVWPGMPARRAAPKAALVATGPREVTLFDGSLVQLNVGGELSEEFNAVERRVRLIGGEAHFSVTPDPARPFVVVAGAVRVRAVGTAFAVNLQPSRVEVLVTEGRVQIATTTRTETTGPLVEAGQRAVLQTEEVAPAIIVTPVDAAEITRSLAWQNAIVRLGGATLGELALEFERRFGVRMVIADPDIMRLRAGGRVRADDPESFAKLLAATFDLDVERTGDGTWVLRKKNSASR